MSVNALSTTEPNHVTAANFNGMQLLYMLLAESSDVLCAVRPAGAPVDLKLRDVLEADAAPGLRRPPGHREARFQTWRLEWQLNHQPWQPDLDDSLTENGIGHMSGCSSARDRTGPALTAVGNGAGILRVAP